MPLRDEAAKNTIELVIKIERRLSARIELDRVHGGAVGCRYLRNGSLIDWFDCVASASVLNTPPPPTLQLSAAT